MVAGARKALSPPHLFPPQTWAPPPWAKQLWTLLSLWPCSWQRVWVSSCLGGWGVRQPYQGVCWEKPLSNLAACHRERVFDARGSALQASSKMRMGIPFQFPSHNLSHYRWLQEVQGHVLVLRLW